MQAFQTPRTTHGYQQPYVQQPPPGYKAPQPVEVYVMPDHANASIPIEIREQFQRDEKGRVLFFTAPPLNIEQPLTKNGRTLGHSARYLASKAKKEAMKAAKRTADDANLEVREEAAKKAKQEEEEKFKQSVSELRTKALRALEDQLAVATKTHLAGLLNQAEQEVKKVVEQFTKELTEVQKVALLREMEHEKNVRDREENRQIPITGMTAMLEEKY
jgi:chromatin structure-remodeling complex subunit RSC1/2